MAYYKAKQENLNYKFPRNEYIRGVDLVRVIDEEGNMLGEMSPREGLEMARAQDLDLVMIAPQAQPPVCKIISWSKFKYEYSKKSRNTKQTGNQMREMWFKPMTGEGDLEHKVKKVREFLEEKHKVKLTVKPGRDRRLDKSHYFDQLKKVLEILAEDADVETPPKLEGKNVYAIIKSKR